MELQEFIQTVLVSVVRGVEGAQKELKDSKAIVNPEGFKRQIALEQLKESPGFTDVEFEVAVEVKNSTEQGGKVAVQVAVFNMDFGGKKEGAALHASRIKFAVPVHLPPGDVLKLEQRLAESSASGA
jgi:hypothetical protein